MPVSNAKFKTHPAYESFLKRHPKGFQGSVSVYECWLEGFKAGKKEGQKHLREAVKLALYLKGENPLDTKTKTETKTESS
jgi:hypothetical protein